MKDIWFKVAIVIILAVLVFEVSVYLNHMVWVTAYAKRSECLERIYARGNNDPFDSKANCYDIVAPIAP